jgi:hypothetical protein
MKLYVSSLIGLVAIATPLWAQDIPDRPVHRSEIIVAAKRQFMAIDANHDGVITRGEFEAFRASRAGQAAATTGDPFQHIGSHWFEHADPNNTGRVTLEMAVQHPLQLFDQADLNHDGILGPEELRIAQAVRMLTNR